MQLLIQLIADITQKPRKRVTSGIDFEWSDKSWTHNMFRVYELLFGRRVGIKSESSVHWDNGVVTYEYHSWESVVAFVETTVRNFTLPRLKIVRVHVPQLVFSNGQRSPYLFAIAFDSASAAATGVSPSYSQTCTGSLLAIILTGQEDGGDFTAVSYAAAALTKDVNVLNSITPAYLSIWHKLSPATGSNTLAVTSHGSATGSRVSSVSYSGVLQSGFPDAVASTASSATVGAGNITITLTTVAANCWAIETSVDDLIGPDTGVVCTTFRTAVNGNGAANDSNGTVATGANSVGYHYTGSNTTAIVALSFAPSIAVADVVVPRGFSLLGVGT